MNSQVVDSNNIAFKFAKCHISIKSLLSKFGKLENPVQFRDMANILCLIEPSSEGGSLQNCKFTVGATPTWDLFYLNTETISRPVTEGV